MKICIVGPMGSGKTTIGSRLAHKLGIRFEDSDRDIQRRTGVDIPYIFETEGEEGFRKREISSIRDLLSGEGDIVLATGGGAVIKPENRENIAQYSTTIYLKTSVEQQMLRTKKDKNRPLLQTEDPRKRLEELYEARSPLYEELADIIVVTDGNGIDAVLADIEMKLKRYI